MISTDQCAHFCRGRYVPAVSFGTHINNTIPPLCHVHVPASGKLFKEVLGP